MFWWACGASMLVPSVDCASLLGDCCCVSHHRVVVWQWLLTPVLYGINRIWMWKWAWCLIIKTSCQSDKLCYEHFVKLQNFILGADILVDIEILGSWHSASWYFGKNHYMVCLSGSYGETDFLALWLSGLKYYQLSQTASYYTVSRIPSNRTWLHAWFKNSNEVFTQIVGTWCVQQEPLPNLKIQCHILRLDSSFLARRAS